MVQHDEATLLERAIADLWPREQADVQTLETHISKLYFVGERVYKVKKPVDYGFLDFTSLESRQHYCEEEVRLNRELAPDVYRHVVPITRERDGRLCIDGKGETVEWAVEMRRLPADRMLDALLARGEVDNAMWRELVALLVRFHAGAATGTPVDEHGSPRAIEANVRENFAQSLPFAGDSGRGTTLALSHRLLAFLDRGALRFLERERELFERRVREGRIREGHGDLHAQNICFAQEGIVIYDRIEFTERFRCGDVACDLAFLAMDLDHAGFPGFAGWLVKHYARESGDTELEELVPFYKAYRAVVRAKVACLRMVAQDGAARELSRREAACYYLLAASYELPPAAILMCGLPATGKSSVGCALARVLRAPLLRSDVRRKVLAGIPLREHAHEHALDAGLYSPQMGARTYRSLLEQAVHEIESGRSVVVDATFSRRAQRAPFVDAMVRLGHPVHVVWLSAPEEVVRKRLEERARDLDEVSDADWQVYLHARENFEPPTELPPGSLIELEVGDLTPVDLAGRAIDRMLRTSSS